MSRSSRFGGKGIDEVIKRLKKAVGKVPLLELMPPAFVQRHTKFRDLQEMVDAAPGAAGTVTQEESAAFLQSPGWSQFVAENSTFSSWQDMMKAAGAERLRKAARDKL